MTHTITDEQLKKYIQQVREFAEVLDEEGLDRDGLHFALYAILDAIEKQTESACALGENCDLTIAYMKGFEDGKDRAATQKKGNPHE